MAILQFCIFAICNFAYFAMFGFAICNFAFLHILYFLHILKFYSFAILHFGICWAPFKSSLVFLLASFSNKSMVTFEPGFECVGARRRQPPSSPPFKRTLLIFVTVLISSCYFLGIFLLAQNLVACSCHTRGDAPPLIRPFLLQSIKA